MGLGGIQKRVDLLIKLVSWLRDQNILVWEGGLDWMWDPVEGYWYRGEKYRWGPRYGPSESPEKNRGPV